MLFFETKTTKETIPTQPWLLQHKGPIRFFYDVQGLAGKARRLATTVAAQEREAAAREGALAAAAGETAAVQSALAEAQLHLQQSSADVQVP